MSSLRSDVVGETRIIDRKISFIWKINKYDASSLDRNGTHSDLILFKNILFRLTAGCQSIYEGKTPVRWFCVTLTPNTTKINFEFFISLKNRDGENVYRKKGYIICEKLPEKLPITREDEISALLLYDCLTIFCEIVLDETTHKNYSLRSQNPVSCSRLNELSNDLEQLLTTKDHSDIIIEVEGQEIPAHSTILAARSSYFSAMFKHDMQESRSRKINITDFGASVINYLLRYLYTGTLEDLKDLPDDLLTELYTAADKYEVNGLKEMCIEEIGKNLSEYNAESYAVLAFTHDEQMLRNAVAEFYARNNELIKSYTWRKLEKLYPTLAILVLSNVKKMMT